MAASIRTGVYGTSVQEVRLRPLRDSVALSDASSGASAASVHYHRASLCAASGTDGSEWQAARSSTCARPPGVHGISASLEYTTEGRQ